MKKMHMFLAAASVSLCAMTVPFLSSHSYSHAEDATGIVQQGDKVVIENDYKKNDYAICTVGYVDKNTHTMVFTGHCSGYDVGKNVYDPQFKKLGKVIYNHGTPETHPDSDYAIVKLDEKVSVGENIYSGDKWSSPEKVKIGDKMCSYGAKSGMKYCGYVTGVNDHYINGDINTGGVSGDSGGPAWVEGKGFVGVYSAVSEGVTTFTYPEEIAPVYKSKKRILDSILSLLS